MTALNNAATSQRPFFKSVGLPVGLALYTLGDEPRNDLERTLARVAGIGYREIELPEFYGKTASELRAAADGAGLTLGSVHFAAGPVAGAGLSMESDPQHIADVLGVMGASQIVMPIAPLPADMRPLPGEHFGQAISRSISEGGADGWKRTAAQLNEKGAALKPYGISVSYHNHNFEFTRFGAETGWDILTRETDPALVSFEVDIGWVAAAGLDPAAFLREHSGRLRQLHIKDVGPSTQPNTALSIDPTEVGSGRLDWARILPAAHAAGCRHFYVEQDPPFAVPRMDSAEKSFTYLSALAV